eukprot:TRINITY_DN70584_c0_g1_i1.p1 TRINITY_DN70584_c0_g1~~TRINITY_DN70584_c0_g1_i1.p1  ORF type:complete len:860 (+),score=162.26 TRINITY_DN70584_c0_g1_i1:52-2631(+)
MRTSVAVASVVATALPSTSGASASAFAFSSAASLPIAFWPTVDGWYWGSACYICRLATQLTLLRLERFRVVSAVNKSFATHATDQDGALRLPVDDWSTGVCNDVVAIFVDAASDLGGSFLRHLATVLAGEYRPWRAAQRWRESIIFWLESLIRGGGGHSLTDWLMKYRETLRVSSRSLCQRHWIRIMAPALHRGQFSGKLYSELQRLECPCTDDAERLYWSLENDRVGRLSLVNESFGTAGLCEHLVPILDAWPVLRRHLPSRLAADDDGGLGRVLSEASCRIAGVFATWGYLGVGGGNGVSFYDRDGRWEWPPSRDSDAWFVAANDVSREELPAATFANCQAFAVTLDGRLRDLVRVSRGVVSTGGPTEGRDLCRTLVAEGAFPSTVHRSLLSLYFAGEGLVEGQQAVADAHTDAQSEKDKHDRSVDEVGTAACVKVEDTTQVASGERAASLSGGSVGDHAFAAKVADGVSSDKLTALVDNDDYDVSTEASVAASLISQVDNVVSVAAAASDLPSESPVAAKVARGLTVGKGWRATVPLGASSSLWGSGMSSPPAAELRNGGSSSFVGPWRASHNVAIDDRANVYSVLVLLGGDTAKLRLLLRFIDDTMIFYRPASSLATEFKEDDVEAFEDLRLRASANVLSEIAKRGRPLEELCGVLGLSSQPNLRWLGEAVLAHWCKKVDLAHAGATEENGDASLPLPHPTSPSPQPPSSHGEDNATTLTAQSPRARVVDLQATSPRALERFKKLQERAQHDLDQMQARPPICGQQSASGGEHAQWPPDKRELTAWVLAVLGWLAAFCWMTLFGRRRVVTPPEPPLMLDPLLLLNAGAQNTLAGLITEQVRRIDALPHVGPAPAA